MTVVSNDNMANSLYVEFTATGCIHAGWAKKTPFVLIMSIMVHYYSVQNDSALKIVTITWKHVEDHSYATV